MRWIRSGLLLLCLLAVASPARASTQETITGVTDLWFEIVEPQVFTVRTYSQNDPHLWLYGPDGGLVAANDDYFGLDSYISVNIVGAGLYRLRAGVCCGNPDAWRGSAYTVEMSVSPVPPTTSTTSTSTTSTTTSTTSTSTTTTTSTTTSTTSTTTSTTTTVAPVESTTTTSEVTTSTSEPTTTTSTTPPTSVPSPTSSIVSSSTSPSSTSTTSTSSTSTSSTTSTIVPTTSTTSSTVLDQTGTTDAPPAPVEEITPPQPPIDASDEVKKEFEAAVNIYDGTHDDYIPVGSKITVAERRTLIAATTALGTLATPVSRRKTK